MAAKAQSFEHHARFMPLYHGFVVPALLVNLFWSIYRVVKTPGGDAYIALLTAIALLGLALSARIAALTVQDRVIRLEMRLRLAQCLPADLQSRIPDFTVAQLIALRFASDQELGPLAAQVLRDNMQDKKSIKKLIRNWQADHQRA